MYGTPMAPMGPWAVPEADSARNDTITDVTGNNDDAGSMALGASLSAKARFTGQEAYEADTHVHSGEKWYGAAATPDGETHVADRIGAGDAGAEAQPFEVVSGADDWGAWTQILGSADTPADGGTASHYDLHRLLITGAEDTAQLYILQICSQEDPPADDPGDSDCYTEFPLLSAGVGALATIPPVDEQMRRRPAGTKCWMRTRAPDESASSLFFYGGLHEYHDPGV